MKATRLFICILTILLISILPISSQTKKQKEEEKQKAIRELVEAQKIRIEVNTAYPMRGPIRNLTTNYSVEIRNDSVFSYLPYFGIAYSIPYGGGKGLIFDAPINEYKLTFDKKGTATIRFKTRTDEDSFIYTLSIFTSGWADVDVTPTNRQAISFRGNFIYDKPSKKSVK
jgi:hypothetical protein